MNGLKLFGKLSIILLIFFSLQGEVIMRYADLFTKKIERHIPVRKNLAERQKLIKLQCFTKNFQPAVVPQSLICHLDQLIGFEFKIQHFPHNEAIRAFSEPGWSLLRGPPSANS
ncbi:MAG: hypothetical protein JWQ54_5072 [Mucilaginibacter sp.]|nr:hypothetical protein [Mucilaginibacter sp.]